MDSFFSFLPLLNHYLFWILIALLCLQVHNIIFHKDVPNIRTAPAIRKRMIQLLKEDYEKRKLTTYVIADLGCGNGLLTREIAKALPQAKVIGIEFTKHTYNWAEMMRKRENIANIEYKLMNVLDYDYKNVDAIVVYLLPYLLDKLGKKLHQDLKPGSFIIANKFKLRDGWVPLETTRVKTLYFHQGFIHTYRKD